MSLMLYSFIFYKNVIGKKRKMSIVINKLVINNATNETFYKLYVIETYMHRENF